jgi:hypothetical protein
MLKVLIPSFFRKLDFCKITAFSRLNARCARLNAHFVINGIKSQKLKILSNDQKFHRIKFNYNVSKAKYMLKVDYIKNPPLGGGLCKKSAPEGGFFT